MIRIRSNTNRFIRSFHLYSGFSELEKDKEFVRLVRRIRKQRSSEFCLKENSNLFISFWILVFLKFSYEYVGVNELEREFLSMLSWKYHP